MKPVAGSLVLSALKALAIGRGVVGRQRVGVVGGVGVHGQDGARGGVEDHDGPVAAVERLSGRLLQLARQGERDGVGLDRRGEEVADGLDGPVVLGQVGAVGGLDARGPVVEGAGTR